MSRYALFVCLSACTVVEFPGAAPTRAPVPVDLPAVDWTEANTTPPDDRAVDSYREITVVGDVIGQAPPVGSVSREQVSGILSEGIFDERSWTNLTFQLRVRPRRFLTVTTTLFPGDDGRSFTTIDDVVVCSGENRFEVIECDRPVDLEVEVAPVPGGVDLVLIADFDPGLLFVEAFVPTVE